ncbi:MAG: EamA family transporter [Desertimonas sp.]
MVNAAAPFPPARRETRRGYALLLSGALLFGLTGPVGKVILDAGVEPARLTALRCTGAAIGLTVVLAARNRRRLRVARRDIPALIVVGLCGAALIQWFYFIAVDRVPIGIALLLEFTAPVLVALYTRVVRRESLPTRVWFGLAVALVGLGLVAQVRGGGLDPIGVLAGFGAAACLATFYLVGKHSLSRVHPVAVTWWMFVVASVFWALVQPWWNFDAGVLDDRVSLLGHLSDVIVPLWAPLLWLVVMGTLMPYGLTIAALSRLSPTTTGIVGMTEPVVAATVAWAWLAQALTAWQLAGGVLVLIAVAVVQAATTDAGASPASSPPP